MQEEDLQHLHLVLIQSLREVTTRNRARRSHLREILSPHKVEEWQDLYAVVHQEAECEEEEDQDLQPLRHALPLQQAQAHKCSPHHQCRLSLKTNRPSSRKKAKNQKTIHKQSNLELQMTVQFQLQRNLPKLHQRVQNHLKTILSPSSTNWVQVAAAISW